LAAAGRHGLRRDEIWDHAQELPGGMAVVPCHDVPGKAASLLHSSGPEIGSWLSGRSELDVIADCGRLGPTSSAVNLAVEADLLLMVVRPSAEQLQPAAERLRILQTRVKQVGWLLIGEQPHSVAEIEETYRLPVAGVLADDRRGAEAIAFGATPKRIRRSALVRSAAGIAEVLHAWLHPNNDASEASVAQVDNEPAQDRADRPSDATAPPDDGAVLPKRAVARQDVGDGQVVTTSVLSTRGPTS